MSNDYLKQLGDQIALTHWAQSNEKTYEEICDRVVNYICADPSDEGRNYNKRMKDLLKSKKFIPNSPCWINSGTDMKNLFACYVVDLQDNMNSIMDAAKRMAMIMKEGGGVGVSLTPIRAEGSRVGGEDSNRTASGPVSFLKVFDAVVGAVKSAGVRRGAALANLKTGHSDIIKFIRCKEDQNQINNFNLSVAITDEFMDDVINKSDKVWAYDVSDDGKTITNYTAADIYDMIVEHMWNNGEPGVQFIDTVNNVDGKYTGRPEFRDFNTGIEVSNPCSESFLKPNEACNLASINLYHFVNPFWKGRDENKDMALRQELKQTVEDAVDFLNLMLDKSETPFPEINEAVHQSRKVGLGVMGLADYLSAKGIVYGSPEAVHEAADVFAFISKTAEEYSLRKGYKNACLTIQAPTGTTGLVGEVSTGIEPHFLRCWTRHSLKMGDLLMYPKSLRDYLINFSTDDSWGQQDEINQAIMLRENMENNNFEEFSKLLESENNVAREIRKYWPTAHEVTPKQHLAMLAAIQRHIHNGVSKTINLPHDATVDDVRELITTAWRSGCKGFTCYRDGSRDSQPLKSIDRKDPDKKFEEIKKSIENGETAFIPRSEYDELLRRAKILEELNDSVDFDLKVAKKMVDQLRSGKFTLVPITEYDKMQEALITMTRFEEDVSKLPPTLLPYKYVVGGRYVKGSAKDFAEDNNVPNKNLPCKRPRPDTTYGETVKTRIGCGTMYITVNSDDNGICEVFTSLGRNGGCPSQSEATSRLISLALRSGVSVEAVIDQLKGIRCMNTMRKGGVKQTDGTVVLSCPDAIGKIMEKVSKDKKSEGLYIQNLRDATPEERDSIQSHLMDIGKDTGLDFYSIIKNAEIKVDDGDKSIKTQTVLLNGNMVCPECGEELKRDGGCVICRHCGYSKCG